MPAPHNQQQFFSSDKLRLVFRWEATTAVVILGFVGITTLSLAVIAKQYSDTFLPNTIVDGVVVGGMSRSDATTVLTQRLEQQPRHTMSLIVDDIMVSSDSASLRIANPYPTLLDQVFTQQKRGSFVSRGISVIKQFFQPAEYVTKRTFEPRQVEAFVEALATKVNISGEKPSAELFVHNNPTSLKIHPGKPGRTVDTSATIDQLNAALAAGEQTAKAVVASTSAPLTELALAAAQERARKFVGASLVVQAHDNKISYTDKPLVSLLAFPNGFSSEKLSDLANEWKTKYNRPPTSAEFVFDPTTLAVTTFVPPRDGLVLDHKAALQDLQDTLTQLETTTTPPASSSATAQQPTIATITLQFAQTAPEKTLAETNNLGITERIGVGNSEYHGSIPTRVHNVALTVSRITNHIVRPGEEFSFNAALGEVSAKTGFKPAYVIRAGRTELGDGGGVCQVSSTLFRALLDSGLDITRRLQHSYRVGYYELNSDPGFDATVYSGNVDLRFKNDTKDHVLIHIENDQEARSMRVELYGTSDGRRTEIVEYQKWGGTGAPAPEYILDPTLAPGQKIQIDWAVGGLKTKFTHRVYKADGELLRENTYFSNYRPWSAKYRVGVLP